MNKNLLLGVTGSIAASKTEKLYNLLKDTYKNQKSNSKNPLKFQKIKNIYKESSNQKVL